MKATTPNLPGRNAQARGGVSVGNEQSSPLLHYKEGRCRGPGSRKGTLAANLPIRRGFILFDLPDCLMPDDPRSDQFVGPFELVAA